MISISTLFFCVLTLFLLILPGFLINKTGLVKGTDVRGINQLLIYIGNPALIMVTFMQPINKELLINCLWVLVFAFLSLGLFTLIAFLSFRNTETAKRNVYRFGSVFSNSAFMGIPVLIAVIGPEAGIYASFYNIAFQLFIWSVGSYFYTGDLSYVKPKKMFINPGIIPLFFGLVLWSVGLGGKVPAVLYDTLGYFRDIVVPISMLLVGIRLADCDLKGIFKNRRLFEAVALRLLILPTAVWAILRLLMLVGLPISPVALQATLICISTPAASFTVAFAERYDGDGAEASKVVSISTLLSVLTMPLVALLLYL